MVGELGFQLAGQTAIISKDIILLLTHLKVNPYLRRVFHRIEGHLKAYKQNKNIVFNENISDGFEFLPPFREGITSDDHPYQKGDKVKVLIRSLSKPSYEFGNQMNNQLVSGGLFATILENVPTNVKNQQPGNSLAIYGWFGTVSETWKEKLME